MVSIINLIIGFIVNIIINNPEDYGGFQWIFFFAILYFYTVANISIISAAILISRIISFYIISNIFILISLFLFIISLILLPDLERNGVHIFVVIFFNIFCLSIFYKMRGGK